MNIEFDWVKPTKGGRSSDVSGVRIYRADYTETRSKAVRQNTVIRLAEDVMSGARFQIGDEAIVGIGKKEGKTVIAIKRVQSGGYTISGRAKSLKGTATTGHVKISRSDIPLGEWALSEIRFESDGSILMMGKQT